MSETGVELWQSDLWKAIIAAEDAGEPDEVPYAELKNFDQPAASRYAATNPTLLAWFANYNQAVQPPERVGPFNFLLSFQAKSTIEMAADDPDALSEPVWYRRHPSPASRYSSNLVLDRPEVFDRETGSKIEWCWLKTYARSLVRYHLHSELKFRGGADDQRGTLERRHVKVWGVIQIGKEADNLEEREMLGEGDDAIEWDMPNDEQVRIAADIDVV